MAKVPSKGKTKNIDLGKGTRKFKCEIKTNDPKKTRDLDKVVYKDRAGEIVDRYFGKMKVHVDNTEISRSGSEQSHVTYKLNTTLRDKEAVSNSNLECVFSQFPISSISF